VLGLGKSSIDGCSPSSTAVSKKLWVRIPCFPYIYIRGFNSEAIDTDVQDHVTDQMIVLHAQNNSDLTNVDLSHCLNITIRGIQRMLLIAPKLESLDLSFCDQLYAGGGFDVDVAVALTTTCKLSLGVDEVHRYPTLHGQ
jgi:hypothetical protein